MVKVQVVDAAGIFVPDANLRVDFKVASGLGAIIGVGNGDPSSHESDKATFRTTFNGLARCIVQTSAIPQHGRVVGSSDGVREDANGGAIILEATVVTAAGQTFSSTLSVPVA